MVLQRLIDEGTKARFTLTDGSIIPVRLRGFGLYEIDGRHPRHRDHHLPSRPVQYDDPEIRAGFVRVILCRYRGAVTQAMLKHRRGSATKRAAGKRRGNPVHQSARGRREVHASTASPRRPCTQRRPWKASAESSRSPRRHRIPSIIRSSSRGGEPPNPRKRERASVSADDGDVLKSRRRDGNRCPGDAAPEGIFAALYKLASTNKISPVPRSSNRLGVPASE